MPRRRKPDVQELSREEQSQLARDIVTRQLAMMDRSRVQLERTLARKEIPADVGEEVLARYEELGLIDDRHFAEVLTRTRFAEKGASRRAIAAELEQKGVERSIIEQAAEQIDSDAEFEAAVDLASKKLRIAGGKPETLYQRTYAMLARRGFSSGMCSSALRTARERLDSEQDQENWG
ncbi:MAG: regulatory protein RecX [Ancrocorticia sp.]|uniref:regulatory protein RecX n=1 Tax=Ancrocorticia sp. TaxID=2593684 RepID=UPI003F8F994E